MATNIILNRGDDLKMMKSVCQGLDDLVYTCSYDILNKCFNPDTIHQINNGLLDNMKTSLDNLKVIIFTNMAPCYGPYFFMYLGLKNLKSVHSLFLGENWI